MKLPTWPENQMPTAEQWLDWLLENDRDDQLAIAQRAMDAAERSRMCFIADHDGAVEQVAQMGKRTLDAYNQGWNDGLEKFARTYEAAAKKELA